MHLLLLEPENQIPWDECSRPQSSPMVVAQVLLVHGCAAEGDVACSSSVSTSSSSASSASDSSYATTRGASNLTSQGRTASAPYTMKNGVYWVDLFGVVRRLHSTLGN